MTTSISFNACRPSGISAYKGIKKTQAREKKNTMAADLFITQIPSVRIIQNLQLSAFWEKKNRTVEANC
jgi:hypothetical protein